ncbi:MAG: 16S rRNA (cytidine(1402)-2'-O)-methyltransferase [bacterium]|nr:MAG: 16S rRNA (cytidine(1402)-2'-O)-methyltransferase [bacterium]
MKTGTLYIVATPIGNLGDVTTRAVEVLSKVDFVAAENMSRTRTLLRHLGLSKPLVSYREENRKRSARDIVDRLLGGQSGAVVTDAGTPGISDPGHYLVQVCLEDGLPVVPIPGVSALTAVLSASGLPVRGFVFEGFLPAKSAARVERLKELAVIGYPLMFYESPRRIRAALTDILDTLGDRDVVLAREVTKVHEEFTRGTVSHVLDRIEGREIKGEVTVLVGGGSAPAEPPEVNDAVSALRSEGLSASRIARILADLTGINRREIYRLAAQTPSAKEKVEKKGGKGV